MQRRFLIHSIALTVLPLIVAAWGLSFFTALLLVGILLLWRWGLSLAVFVAPPREPELVLESISASHFVEKVRWCLDRLGLEYAERPAPGALGAFSFGRTVPRLDFRTGAVRSSIGNSAEILRYLWGRYGADDNLDAAFLRPDPDSLELEQRSDAAGAALQVWVYYHLLDHPDLTLHAWGANDPRLPAWQRGVLKAAFPLLRVLIRRSFRISDTRYRSSVERVDALLDDAAARLHPDSRSLCGRDAPCHADFAFAAINGLWLMPPNFGGGKSNGVRFDGDVVLPDAMLADARRWRERQPAVTIFIDKLFAEERLHAS